MGAEPPSAATQQEPEELSSAATEALFILDHRSGLLLFRNTRTVKYSKPDIDLAPVDPPTSLFLISHMAICSILKRLSFAKKPFNVDGITQKRHSDFPDDSIPCSHGHIHEKDQSAHVLL